MGDVGARPGQVNTGLISSLYFFLFVFCFERVIRTIHFLIYSMKGHVKGFIFRNVSLRACGSFNNNARCLQIVREKHQISSNNSFVHNIFRGRLDPTQVLPYPVVLTEDERETLSLLLPAAEKVIKEQNDALLNDELEAIPAATLEAVKAAGGYGAQVPEEFGGAGLNSTQYGRLTEVIGANDLGLGVFLTGHQGIGFKGILLVGSEDQKDKYLADLAAGRKMAAFALTEPGSGSDASSISTRAELSSDGSHYIMNGSKIWITGGGLADIFTVFAKTPVTDDTGNVKEKMTAFIVERSFGGVSNGPPEKKMGIKCSNTAEVYFENTRIPKENVLGGVGNGFKVAMQILNNGRFGMGTSLSGTMRQVISKATEHVTSRTQFGSKLHQFGTIQEKLGRMSLYHYATESLAYMVSGTMDSGCQEYQLEAAVSKIFSSEAAWFVTDEAIQMLGGTGYMRDCGLEKILRDLRIFRIFEGTNDILRLFIALTGLQYAGNHLKQLQAAAKNPLQNLNLLAGEVNRRTTANLGLTKSALEIHPNLSQQAEHLSQQVLMFGKSSEKMLIKYKKDVINQQFLLNRVADVAIDIYVSMCLLSRCSRSIQLNLDSAHHEEQMTKLWCSEAQRRISRNLSLLTDPSSLSDFNSMRLISEAVCAKNQSVQSNPVGF